jgi:molybdopterin molybdotransferase
MSLLSVSEALRRVLDGIEPPAVQTVSIYNAEDRVLARDLEARLTQPPFAASAMDGYALRGADLGEPGTRLTLIGTSSAGHGSSQTVGPGQAVRIFTGAPIPPGADTVVIQEDVDRDGDAVVLREIPRAGANVRQAGVDFREGHIGLNAGRRLDARALTLAAAMGHSEIPVARRPVVALLATGDELVPPGTPPGLDQIISSNPVGLAALVRRAGGEPHLLGIARDTEESITSRIAAAGKVDILVTTGGASVGDHDLVAPVLTKLGMQLDFWKVALRPGKPLIFGRLGKTRMLGLPGNPVSAYVCGRLFLAPLIHALLGERGSGPDRRRARITHVLGSNGPRLHLMRAICQRAADGALEVTAVPSQDSSLVSALSEATCLIVREPDAPALGAGDQVEIDMLVDG